MTDAVKGQFELQVVRDSAFQHRPIDNAFFTFLGRDVEASFLVINNSLGRVADVYGEEWVDLATDVTLSEVVRLRMAPEVASIMMQNIAGMLLQNFYLSTEELDEIVQKLKDRHQTTSQGLSDADQG